MSPPEEIFADIRRTLDTELAEFCGRRMAVESALDHPSAPAPQSVVAEHTDSGDGRRVDAGARTYLRPALDSAPAGTPVEASSDDDYFRRSWLTRASE